MMKFYKQLLAVLLLTLLYSTTSIAETLTVDAGDAVAPGATGVTVNINLDDTTRTAGAAFTITYDTDMLTLTDAASSFFDMLSEPVIIDPDTYDQALVYNTDYDTFGGVIPEGVMIAGAKADNGDLASLTTILTLTFDVDPAATGDYPIDIVQSIITNTDAGYDANPAVESNKILMLVGVDDSVSPTEYPAIPMAEMTLVSDNLSVGDDSDGDGISDQWEIDTFGDLTTADETSDFDQDGYSDLLESTYQGTTDLLGNLYDPKRKNAPGDTGYFSNTDSRVKFDFNADGKNDIIWVDPANGNKFIWTMDGVTITAVKGYGDIPIEALADFNGDGKLDIVTIDPIDGRKFIWLMDGTVIDSKKGYGGNYISRDIEQIADFNGDGKADILWIDPATRIRYIWIMDGTIITDAKGYAYFEIDSLTDFNGDGKTDLVWIDPTGRKTIWLMDGTTRSGKKGYGGNYLNRDIESYADFNGDGKSDILWIDPATNGRYIWLMDGITIIGAKGYIYKDIHALADFDGDSKTDIIWMDPIDGRKIIWTMDGTTKVTERGYGGGYLTRNVEALADFNGDGNTDIIWIDPANDLRYVWIMNGSSIITNRAFSGSDLLGVADFNGDGKSDTIWNEIATGTKNIWIMDGTDVPDDQSYIGNYLTRDVLFPSTQ